jgi:ribosome-associated protein
VTERSEITDSDLIDLLRKSGLLLSEKKGLDVVMMDLREVNSYLDYFLIVTGNSRIHCRALAREMERFIHSQGLRQRNRPDYESGWIILDFSELIVHVFTSEMREYYQLEKLWGDARRIS